VAPEKTCLTTAVPFRPPSTAPIMNVVRITPCQSGVIGKLMMAWATIDGKRDRVQANTTPNPIAITNKLAIMALLYGLGHQVLGVREGEQAGRRPADPLADTTS
jgi:hypothetical protein